MLSSVPTHLSKEMSDYAWPLRRAVLPAVATCTSKRRPPPQHSPSHPLTPCQHDKPVDHPHCSTVIYYTVQKHIYFIMFIAGKKWLHGTDKNLYYGIWMNQGVWQATIVWGSFMGDTFKPQTLAFPLFSIPREHIYNTGVKKSGFT